MEKLNFFDKSLIIKALSTLMMLSATSISLSLAADLPGRQFQQDNRRYQNQYQYQYQNRYPYQGQSTTINPGYPGYYSTPYDAFPDQQESEDIYKANQHPPH